MNNVIKEAIVHSESKKTKKDKSLVKDELDKVFNYMKNQNRPYIANDVFLNLGKLRAQTIPNIWNSRTTLYELYRNGNY